MESPAEGGDDAPTDPSGADDAGFLREVLIGAFDAALVCDVLGSVRWSSPTTRNILGTDAKTIEGRRLLDLVHPDDQSALSQLLDQVSSDADGDGRLKARLRRTDGAWRRCEIHIRNALSLEAVGGLVLNLIDVTDRALDEVLSAREEFLHAVLDAAHEGVWVLDDAGHTVFANRRMSQLLRVPMDLLTNHPIEDVLDADLAREVRLRLGRRKAGIAESYELLIRPPGQPEVWVAVSAAPLPAGVASAIPGGGTVALVADITARKEYEAALERHAFYDTLTGLPNRALLDLHLREATGRHQASGEHFAYLLCNIDGLKLVNDALGSIQGDELIREIAVRLGDAARANDVIARTTGDNFVVLATDTEVFQAGQVARDLAEAVEGVVDLAGSSIWPSISVGAASTSDVRPEALESAASDALRCAKQRGRGSTRLFNAAAPRDHRAALEMLADLRGAPASGALQMSYQPIVSLSTNEVVGAEALMRWSRPGHGDVPPGVFIPLAEEFGLIGEIGTWALRRACQDAAGWEVGRAISINLSPLQLTAGLVDTVSDVLHQTGLLPERLWLEVTETALFADTTEAGDLLRRLVDLGVRISLDDFGTGYSSMAYLRDLPVHALKVDRTFISGLGRNFDDTAIATTLIKLAASLNVRMIAEGVETPEQLDTLRRLGCEFGQGYIWSPAQPNEQFAGAVLQIERDGGPTTSRYPGPGPVPKVREPDTGVMARILQMHGRGASPAGIAAELNQDAIPPPTGKRWRRVTIAHLIAQSDPGEQL